MTIISTTVGKNSLEKNEVALRINKIVQNTELRCNLKCNRMISVCFQSIPFSIIVIQEYGPTSNAEEAEVEWFYEDIQDRLEITPPQNVLFIIGDWNVKLGSQETSVVTGKFGLRVQNEVGQRLIEFCQDNTLEKHLFLLY